MQPDTTYPYRPEMPYRNWTIGFGVSLAIHFLTVAAIVFLPSGFFRGNRIERPPGFDVQLVSLNPELPYAAGGSGAPVASVQPVKPNPPVEKTEPAPRPVQAEPEPDAVPIKIGKEKKINPADAAVKPPEPVVKKSLKKKTFNPDKVIASAVKQIEEKNDTDRPDSVQQRIEQMKSQIGSRPDTGRVDDNSGKTASTSGSSTGSGGYASGGIAGGSFTQMQIYQAEVAVRMKQNWAFSPELAGNTQGMESRVVIKILGNGQITDVWYEKKSGNSYLDESAYRTIMKSNPLPPLPDGESYYHLVLGFTPSGLK